MAELFLREHDVALGTIVRLRRNWRDLPFPPSMTDSDMEECLRRVWEALDSANETDKCRFRRMSEMRENERNDLVNRRALPEDIARNDQRGAAYFLRDNRVCVGVGGTEQLCLQSRLTGFAPEEALQCVMDTDRALADRAQYAYDPRFGYLTGDPLLAGTGMTVEVILHLQSLSRSGKMAALEKEIKESGLSLAPVSKEANLYALSNPNTFGMGEEDIFNTVSAAALQLIEKERQTRDSILKNGKIFLIDAAMRSAGLGSSARIMKKSEFMRLYGDMRLGAALGILRITLEDMDETLFLMQTEALRGMTDAELKGLTEDIFRAEQLRRRLLAITHN